MELFICDRKLNISICFHCMIILHCSKIVRLSLFHGFIMKIPNEQELQQIASNHSFDRVHDDFMKIYKKSTSQLYSFFD